MNLVTRWCLRYKKKFSLASILWFTLAVTGIVLKVRLGNKSIGNYLVFEKAFYHAIHQINLYRYYPSENLGSYLYGPLFSILIAPFAVLPTFTGAFIWGLFNASILFFAVRQLPLGIQKQNIILIVSGIEMMTCIENMESNCLVAALILFSFNYLKKEKYFWSAFFIALGFLIKIYGMAGLSFLFFSKKPMHFILYLLLWLSILICFPMLISSPAFISHSYTDWYYALVTKDNVNILSDAQNISVMGMMKRLFNIVDENTIILFIASWFYLLPLFRKKQINAMAFQLYYLAFLLIGIVIFSSSAESPTYIIAITGVSIWFVLQDRTGFLPITLLFFTLIFSSLATTDFFPSYIKINFIKPYAIKALPCIVVWVVIAGQLLFKKFADKKPIEEHGELISLL